MVVALSAVLTVAGAGCQGSGEERSEERSDEEGSVPAAGKPVAHADAAPEPRPPPHAPGKCADADSVTFIFASDTHFGHNDEVDRRNLEQIRHMNAIAGKSWPAALGGRVGEPCGVLLGGDLTERGAPWEWDSFANAYGLVGGDGALRIPVFEVHGNHDKNSGLLVRQRVAERHGGEIYSFTWGAVHVVALGEAPDDEDRAWLRDDLAKLKPGTGVVLYFHFPLDGPYSKGQWFGDADDGGGHRARLVEVLEGVNGLGVFHGHYHATGFYRYHGLDVYRAGSPKHAWHTFTVAEIAGGAMKVASWDYDKQRWGWWHQKPAGDKGPRLQHRPADVPRD